MAAALFEFIADQQKLNYKRNPVNGGRWCTFGEYSSSPLISPLSACTSRGFRRARRDSAPELFDKKVFLDELNGVFFRAIVPKNRLCLATLVHF